MSESPLSREELESADTLLQDLLDGRDRLLTAGETAELLNINVNTLYLWRSSGEVDLPFQRFISPGQTRGIIRYKYSDVVLFLARATKRGKEEAELETVDGTENEDGVPTKLPAAQARKKNRRRKQKLGEKLRNLPLEEILAATQDGTNLSVEESRARRAAELAPPEDAEIVTDPGAIVYDDTPEPETQEPVEIVQPAVSKDQEAAAAEWLARFNIAFSHQEDADQKEDQ
jgi:hypothetical protein